MNCEISKYEITCCAITTDVITCLWIVNLNMYVVYKSVQICAFHHMHKETD